MPYGELAPEACGGHRAPAVCGDMNRHSFRSLWLLPRLSLMAALVSVPLAGCEEGPQAPAGADLAASALARPTPTPLPPLAEGLIDVSGCWRPVGANNVAAGSPFELRRVSPDGFVFATQPTRTKLVFNASRGFEEVNFDEAKPFFPKGYHHSTGTVSPDGSTIGRSFAGGGTQPHVYRRCNQVIERPVSIPDTPLEPQPSLEPTPEPTRTPLLLPPTPQTPRPPVSQPSPEASQPPPAEEQLPAEEQP